MAKPEEKRPVERNNPALLNPGERVLSLLTWQTDGRNKRQPSQVVMGIDPPIFKIKGDTCEVIKEDYLAPETCDGDCNKRAFDCCCFSTSLLDEALSRIQPGGRVDVSGKAIFTEELHEWGTDYEEFERHSQQEDVFSFSLELSRLGHRVVLTVRRENRVYAVVKKTAWLCPFRQPAESQAI